MLTGCCALAVTLLLTDVAAIQAAEAYATDGDASGAVFVSDGEEPNDVPPAETGSTVVMVEDLPLELPAAANVKTPSIAQQRSEQFIKPRILTPADLRGQSRLSEQVAQRQTVAQPMQQPTTVTPASTASVRDQPGDIQIAVHNQTVRNQYVAPQSETSRMAKLLVVAHKQSLSAETDDDYTRIIQAAQEAQRLGAADDRLQFARELGSWALNRRGQLQSESDNQALADTDFQAAVEMNPRNWRALHNRGVSFAQANQFAEAFDDFNAVLQINPNYAKAYANRATLYVQAKDLHSAIGDYQQALAKQSDFATAHVGLGRVYHMLGKHEEAVEHFTAAIELKPGNAAIVCSRGDLHSDMGSYGLALADYARTIDLDPEFAHAYRNGAWLLATCPDERFRDPTNAVQGARQALEYGYGDRHVALDTLAAALASAGDFEEAIQTETEAVDIAPEEAKYTYLSRLQLYQSNQPFRTEPVGEVSQAAYQE